MTSTTRTIDTGHENTIHCVELDYHGITLATCSSDGSINVFDIRNGSQILLANLRGHQGPVWQIAWAHPKFGSLLASCSYDKKVIIWKNDGKWFKFYEYNEHSSSVNSIAWAPYEFGLILACGSSDKSISILTYNTGSNTWDSEKITNAHMIGCSSVSWCPATISEPAFCNVSINTAPISKRFTSGGYDNCVKIWRENQDRWILENRLEGHSDWVVDVAWSPNIGFNRHKIASSSKDRRVIIWTTDDMITWTPNNMHTFSDTVTKVSWSPTGNILAVSDNNNQVTLWRESFNNKWTCTNSN